MSSQAERIELPIWVLRGFLLLLLGGMLAAGVLLLEGKLKVGKKNATQQIATEEMGEIYRPDQRVIHQGLVQFWSR